MLEQSSMRGLGISILGDVKKLPKALITLTNFETNLTLNIHLEDAEVSSSRRFSMTL